MSPSPSLYPWAGALTHAELTQLDSAFRGEELTAGLQRGSLASGGIWGATSWTPLSLPKLRSSSVHGAWCSHSPRMAEGKTGQSSSCSSLGARAASSLGLSHAWERHSTVIIIINWFISRTTFCLPDSPAAHKGQCLSAEQDCPPLLVTPARALWAGPQHHPVQSLTPLSLPQGDFALWPQGRPQSWVCSP